MLFIMYESSFIRVRGIRYTVTSRIFLLEIKETARSQLIRSSYAKFLGKSYQQQNHAMETKNLSFLKMLLLLLLLP